MEFVLATTDPNLYDETNDKWIWSGSMYWTVECLPNRQSTVADNMLPGINSDNYMVLEKSPVLWDYCKSKQCTKNSDTMQLVFTFNPKSTDPNDYLQFVIDIHCQVTDYPKHSIKDNDGKEFYLDIVEVSKMTKQPYVEIWIAKATGQDGVPSSSIHQSKTQETTSSVFIWVIIIMLILLVLLTGGFFLYFY